MYNYMLVPRSFDYAYGAAQDDIKYIELRMTYVSFILRSG